LAVRAGLSALTVNSLGGNATGDASVSRIMGDLGFLRVQTDVKGSVLVRGVSGNIGGVRIGGSLLGGAADGSGVIDASGSIGRVQIAGDIRGGAGFQSGAIVSVHRINGVSIGGSLLGGTGQQSGLVSTGSGLQPSPPPP